MGEEGGEALDGDYSELKDLRIRLDKRVVSGGDDPSGDLGFCLCFWLYLKGPINSSTVVLRQVYYYLAQSLYLHVDCLICKY